MHQLRPFQILILFLQLLQKHLMSCYSKLRAQVWHGCQGASAGSKADKWPLVWCCRNRCADGMVFVFANVSYCTRDRELSFHTNVIITFGTRMFLLILERFPAMVRFRSHLWWHSPSSQKWIVALSRWTLRPASTSSSIIDHPPPSSSTITLHHHHPPSPSPPSSSCTFSTIVTILIICNIIFFCKTLSACLWWCGKVRYTSCFLSSRCISNRFVTITLNY